MSVPKFENVLQDPRVLDAMLPYLTHYYGNPHSRTHAYGWESEHAMEVARGVSSFNFLLVFFKVYVENISRKPPMGQRQVNHIYINSLTYTDLSWLAFIYED